MRNKGEDQYQQIDIEFKDEVYELQDKARLNFVQSPVSIKQSEQSASK